MKINYKYIYKFSDKLSHIIWVKRGKIFRGQKQRLVIARLLYKKHEI